MGVGTRVRRFARDAWIVFGIALLLFALLEGVLSLAAGAVGNRRAPAAVPDFRARADVYPDPSWVPAYYEEFRRSRVMRWEPYVYWRRRAFRGEYITVDDAGVRRTVAPGPGKAGEAGEAWEAGDGPAARIFMFGGSTMWGTGARDAFTIPSLLARELHARGVPAEVTNLGETGYVSGQEVAMLEQRLRRGDVPDLVVFYDGVNDTFSAWQQGEAGLPLNEFRRVREFNLSNPELLGHRVRLALRDAVERLETVRHAKRLLRTVGFLKGGEGGSAAPTPRRRGREEARELADGVAAAYGANLELVRALGASFGFRSLFYWQPTVFDKKSRTPYEQQEARRRRAYRDFFRRAYARVREAVCTGEGRAPCRDLSRAFAGHTEALFVDWSHVGEGGNAILASAMAADVVAALEGGLQRDSERPSPRP